MVCWFHSNLDMVGSRQGLAVPDSLSDGRFFARGYRTGVVSQMAELRLLILLTPLDSAR